MTTITDLGAEKAFGVATLHELTRAAVQSKMAEEIGIRPPVRFPEAEVIST
jgi:hypothetical protein